MSYIDGFVVPVPTGNKEKYIKVAREAADTFRKHGALRVIECWGDHVPDGTVTDFKMAVKAEPGETVCFSWIEWPSKQVRDEAYKKMEGEMSMKDAPFDGKRMIWGGFDPLVDVGSATGRES